MEIKNKGVLITGGASGLGGACAQLLAQQGAKVAIADLNGESGRRAGGQVERGREHGYICEGERHGR